MKILKKTKNTILIKKDISSSVIFFSVAVDEIVKLCHKAVFDNTGQICSAASRTFVHHSIYDDFVSKSVELALKRRLGDPFDPQTEQGPQVRIDWFWNGIKRKNDDE